MSPIPCERQPKRKKTATQLLTTSKLPALPNSGRVHRCRRRQIAFSHTKLTTNLHYQKSPKLRSVTLRKTIQTLNKTNLPKNAINNLKIPLKFSRKTHYFPSDHNVQKMMTTPIFLSLPADTDTNFFSL
jgi:hypothetical protein